MRKVHTYMLLAGVLTAGLANAQGFPNKPIRIFTTGAGGSNDLVMRAITAVMSPAIGQPIMIENRPAGFELGSSVSQAAPDGYTLLAWSGTLWIAPLLEKAPYDPVRDFAPVGILARSPSILVVHPSVPAQTVPELIKLAKAQPGKVTYTTGATGGSSHTGAELFKAMAGADIPRVASNGSGEELNSILTGKVQLLFGAATSMVPHIKAGKLRALASTGLRRSQLYPDMPTVAETLPGFSSEQLLGLFAPAKTPDAVVGRINQEAGRALESTQVRDQLLKIGQEPAGGPPDLLGEHVKVEIARVSKLIK